MSESLEALRRQRGAAAKLGTVVRTMKAMAAANIGHYEEAVASLARYRTTLDRGLGACLRDLHRVAAVPVDTGGRGGRAIGILAFGSDQGLVGDFNDALATHIARVCGAAADDTTRVWVVGERLAHALTARGYRIASRRSCPWGIEGVSALVGELLRDLETARSEQRVDVVHVCANEPGGAGGRRPAARRLLPLGQAWRDGHLAARWPGECLPETLGGAAATLPKLLRQHLFVELYTACAHSLAAENLSRLLAMQRAERNIDELVGDLGRRYHRERQSAIDDELFDVVAGFEALNTGTLPTAS